MAVPTKGPKDYLPNPFATIQDGDPQRGAMATTEEDVIKQLTKDIAAGWDINSVDSTGGTFLINAAETGMEKTCLWLIDQGIDVTPKDDEFQRTALHWAAGSGLEDVVKRLHKKGLPIDEKDVRGFTPLLLVFAGAKESEVFGITNIAHTDEKGKEINNSPLVNAVKQDQSGFIETARFLCEQGVDVNAQTTEKGHTALHFAADAEGFVDELVQALLVHKPNVNIKAKEAGIAPLHFACRHGNTSLVNILLEAGADPNQQDDYGFTPLHEAADNNHVEVVELLLKKGADKTIGVTKGFKPYTNHETALDMATARGHKATMELLK